MAKTYPPVQPGGSLILAWQIKHKKVLVVGGGEVRLNHHHMRRASDFDV
jgi:siroheme synthase (precorrin-2 oxidase/ferrochelatase)